VFVIQNTQNRDGTATQAKLDELIRSSAAQNRFIGIEQLTAEEIAEYRDHCQALAKKALERAAEHSRKTRSDHGQTRPPGARISLRFQNSANRKFDNRPRRTPYWGAVAAGGVWATVADPGPYDSAISPR